MQKITKSFGAFIVLILSLNISNAQYNPHFLIPYKSGNHWGWSDTLGNIVIKPKFSSATFFYEFYPKVYFAKLGNPEEGFRYIKPDGNFIFKPHLVNKYDGSIRDLISIENREGKKAVYSFDLGKIAVPEGQDEVIIYGFDNKHLALFKKNSEKTYKILDENRNIQKTEIVQIELIKQYGFLSTILFKDAKNRFGKIEGTKLSYLSDTEYATFKAGQENFETAFLSKSYPDKDEAPDRIKAERREKIKTFEARTGMIVKDEFTYDYLNKPTFFSILRDGREGVYTQEGEVFVPVIYDEVTFVKKGGTGITIKNNGKYGFMKIPAGKPVIEPKYDSPILVERNLSEKNTSFLIYQVKINDEYVFVGQNGIEFFND